MAFNFKKALALSLSAAMVLTAAPVSGLDVQAASVKKVTVKVGATKKVTLKKKATKSTIKYAKAAQKKVVKVTYTKKTGKVNFKGLKAGKATVTVKLTLKNKKTKTQKYTVTVSKAAVALKSVSLSTSEPKVGATLTAKLNPSDATNVAGYQWYADGTAIVGATSKDYIVMSTDIDKKLKVVVTDKNGNTFESAESSAVANDLSGTFELKDDNGLQKDGTALPTDTLRVNYGSSLGTPKNITWYCSGAVMAVYSLNNGNLNQNAFNSNACRSKKLVAGAYTELAAGEWMVIIENTDGKIWTSNGINVVYEGQAVLSDVSFEDDYETTSAMRIDLDDETNQTILNVTFNKDYSGKLYLIEDKFVKNYSNTQIANVSGNTYRKVSAMLTEVNTAAQLTNKRASEEINKVGGKAGIYYEDAAGALHCKWRVDLDDAGNSTVTRGTSYYLAWDQEDVNDDEPDNTAKKEELNTTTSATVPYVTAPASIKVTSFVKKSDTVKAEAYDANGNKLAWYTAANLATAGLSSAKVFNTDTNSKSSSDTGAEVGGATVKEGELTLTKAAGTYDDTYAYVRIKTLSGVFGKDAVTLESDLSEAAREAVTSIEITEDKENPENAIVKFKGLSSKAPGKVYILQGKYVDGISDFNTYNTIKTIDTDDAVGEAVVPGGASTVTVNNVFKASYMEDTAVSSAHGTGAYENLFVAKFVPDDEELWESAYGGNDKANTVFTLEPEITTLDKSDMTGKLGTVNTGAHTAVLTIGGIRAKDQFGNDWKAAANRTKDVAVVDKKINKDATSAEDSAVSAVATVNGTTSLVTFDVTLTFSGTDKFDKNDGCVIKVESLADLTVTITAKDLLNLVTNGVQVGTTVGVDTTVGGTDPGTYTTGATKNEIQKDNDTTDGNAPTITGTLKLSDAFDIN